MTRRNSRLPVLAVESDQSAQLAWPRPTAEAPSDSRASGLPRADPIDRTEFRLLGPLGVRIDGRVVDIGAARTQVVLAMLLLETNRIVPVGRLIEALWDEAPPLTAKAQIQTCVSVLRRRLADRTGSSVIETHPAGYLIRVPDESVDVHRFSVLAAGGASAATAGRREEAVRHLRDALALWQGPAAVGVESRVVQMAATRLDEDRLAVLEDCIELELQLGRHHEVVAELRQLVAEHPWRERLRGLLMLALYRSGRQAEALESFRTGREILLDDLGLDPGEPLRALEQAILINDPALDPPASLTGAAGPGGLANIVIPRQLPAAIPDFAGRREILDLALAGVLSPASGERGDRQHMPVLAFTGKGGVGKTVLAVRVAHLIREEYPDGQLFAQLHAGNGQPKTTADQLALFLQAVGVSSDAMPSGLEDRTALFRSLLAERRMLIVLDDAANLRQVQPLLPGDPGCAVIITSRQWLSGLPGTRLEIPPLDETSGLDLLSSVIGAQRVRAEPASARELVRLCDSLPLALRIAAAKLAARPHWPVRQMVDRLGDEKRRLDELDLEGVSIEATISFAHESLDPDAKRLFRRISLLATNDFASWVCAPLLAADPDHAGDVLDRLVEARLVEVQVREGRPVRFQLHNLVRIYALERLANDEPATERAAALSRLIGCLLSLAAEAHRREYGGDFSLLHGATPLWHLPTETVEFLLVHPIGWLRSEHQGLVAGVLQAGRAGLDELCWDLAVTSVTLFESGSFVEDWRTTHESALEAVRRAGNRRGEAALLYSLGTLALTERLDNATAYLHRALDLFAELGDAHGVALTHGGLAFLDRLTGDYGSALDRYWQALTRFRQVGDGAGEAGMLKDIAQILSDQQQYGVAEQLFSEALACCRRLGARRLTAQTEYLLAELYVRTGHLDRAERTFDSARLTAASGDDVIGEGYALLGLATVRAGRGDYEAARADLQAGLTSAVRTRNLLLHGRVLLALAELDCRMDRAGSATALLDEALGVLNDFGPAAVWRARVLELRGMLDDQAGRGHAAVLAWRAAMQLAADADTALTNRLINALADRSPIMAIAEASTGTSGASTA